MVEHNPIEIWERTTSVLMSTLNATNLSSKTLLHWESRTSERRPGVDRHTGRPYYNAIVWQDTRTTDRVGAGRDGRAT